MKINEIVTDFFCEEKTYSNPAESKKAGRAAVKVVLQKIYDNLKNINTVKLNNRSQEITYQGQELAKIKRKLSSKYGKPSKVDNSSGYTFQEWPLNKEYKISVHIPDVGEEDDFYGIEIVANLDKK